MSVVRGGLLWLIITGAIIIVFIYELFLGKPASLFKLPRFITVALGIYGFYRKGGCFVGTGDQLLKFNSWKELSTYKWSDFLMVTNESFNSKKGDVTFSLKEKSFVRRNNRKIWKE